MDPSISKGFEVYQSAVGLNSYGEFNYVYIMAHDYYLYEM